MRIKTEIYDQIIMSSERELETYRVMKACEILGISQIRQRIESSLRESITTKQEAIKAFSVLLTTSDATQDFKKVCQLGVRQILLNEIVSRVQEMEDEIEIDLIDIRPQIKDIA